ncbi:Protein ArsC [Planococcus massiliensis]|uniref:Protein ArsC n=1 Tax=Planococcus massiliensis TaxID=1499687 RepID=A0A098ENY1_9BACL|nr:arsenate reductase [Planococcus massiliensis]CEG23510.1 Protein ArsC [Planococcus massiliensis]
MTKHTVYFLSPQQHRGLMAEIWANRLNLPDWDIRSAAWSQPLQSETPYEIMKEIVLDVPDVEPRFYDSKEVSEADLIVALHDGDFESADIPSDLPAQKLVRWNIRNPELRASDESEQWAIYQEVCDEIAMNIKGLEPYFRSNYM